MKCTIKNYVGALALLLGSQLSAQYNLNVVVNNLYPTGNVYIGLFNKKETFPKPDKQYLLIKMKPGAGTGKSNSGMAIFKNLPKGDYAIALFQDKNGNGKVDKNLLGVPTEGIGFSNNFRPTITVPVFNDAKFNLSSNKTIQIKLIPKLL